VPSLSRLTQGSSAIHPAFASLGWKIRRLFGDFRPAQVGALREGHMNYAIGTAPSVFCLSLLMLGCTGKEAPLAPEVRPLASVWARTSAAVTDPEGDAVASDGSGVVGEAYQDIVGADVSKTGRNFVFVMDVAGPLPARRARHHGRILQEWSWNLNTDPSTFPAGFPFAPGTAAPPEFIVLVLWDGRTFRGSVIDRRPLLTGEDVRVTSVHFRIKRATVEVSVNAALLGNPATFTWVARTNNWLVRMGTGDPQTLDRAPDTAPAFWP
jgi:hypothetical protein